MLFQLAEPQAQWIIGLSLIFVLSLFMSYITDKQTDTFFIYLTIFSGFAVWAGLLDLWILIVCIIIITLLMIMNIKSRQRF